MHPSNLILVSIKVLCSGYLQNISYYFFLLFSITL